MIAMPKTKMHVDEYYELPETMKPIHLIDGVLIEMPSPKFSHQQVLIQLVNWFSSQLQRIGGVVSMAPTDVHLDAKNIPQPDLLWIAQDRMNIIVDDKVMGAPDFIAEVLSLSTRKFDRTTKFRLYEKFGVRELWFVDPEARLIEVWTLIDGKFQYLDGYGFDETFQSPLFGTVDATTIFFV